MKSLVTIYKSPKREGMYLYLNKGAHTGKDPARGIIASLW